MHSIAPKPCRGEDKKEQQQQLVFMVQPVHLQSAFIG